MKEPHVRTISIGDHDIEYLEYDGEGPVIIMLHATGFLPWLWHPIARRLGGEYRIIAPYFCDHREAEPEDGGLSWMILAEDICELCSRLKLENPFMVGHSMGATILTLANASLGLKASGLAAFEPIYLPEQVYEVDLSVEQHPLAAKSIKRRNFWEDHEQARDYLRSKKLFASWDEEVLELYLEHGMISREEGGLSLACHPRKEASLFLGGSHRNPWPLLKKLTCPVLVIEGETSGNRSFIDLQKAVSMMPEGGYRLVEGAGHLIPMEKPEESAQLISEFFGKIKNI